MARQRGIGPTLSHSTVALILHDAELATSPHALLEDAHSWTTPSVAKRPKCCGATSSATAWPRGTKWCCAWTRSPTSRRCSGAAHAAHAARPHRAPGVRVRPARHGESPGQAGGALRPHAGLGPGENDSAAYAPCCRSCLRTTATPAASTSSGTTAPATSRQADGRLPSPSLPACPGPFTPAHASWLNQAELLLRAFGARYLQRGRLGQPLELVAHLDASWPEYNRFYAHPFTWSWTRAKMHSVGGSAPAPDYVEKLVGHSTREHVGEEGAHLVAIPRTEGRLIMGVAFLGEPQHGQPIGRHSHGGGFPRRQAAPATKSAKLELREHLT